MPARLRPTAPIAADAILVGDPGRALMLAQELLEQPKMSNHARGLWGYSGLTPAGHELTIQATGMGGPSASVVLGDLAVLGVKRAIRIGTCTSLGDPGLGELVVVTQARPIRGSFAGSETTKEPRDRVEPDPTLTRQLREALPAAVTGIAISLDHLHDSLGQLPSLPGDVADMQTAALFEVAGARGITVAAVLIVTERAGTEPLDGEPLEGAAKRAGQAAASLL
jgi:uridine phosphorylase